MTPSLVARIKRYHQEGIVRYPFAGTVSPMTEQRAALTPLDSIRRELQAWAKVYGERDERVRQAKRSGLSTGEIARLTGLAKTTVLRILAGVQ